MRSNLGKLAPVIHNKIIEVEAMKAGMELFGDIDGKTERPFLSEAIRAHKFGVIAEIKRSSPSEGKINYGDSPLQIASVYEQNGATAISVLTDNKFFGGSFDILRDIANKVSIPVLCKEFIIDPVQIELASRCNASAILLITDILDDNELVSLFEATKRAGMEALVEAHSPENIRRAVDLGAEIIGINNRNLFTFEVDLYHSIGNIEFIPDDRIRLSLSAVKSSQDIQLLKKAGFDGVLVGTSLMQSSDIGGMIRGFRE
jgi:indole-3-glycerol phosphate synthase